jgi:hypothetical protein
MISQSDIQGRLRLLRYGLLVVVVVAFLVSLLVPYVVAAPYAAEINNLARTVEENGLGTPGRVDVTIGTFLTQAILTTVIVAIVCVIIYFAYRMFLMRTVSTGTSTARAR